MTKYPKRIQRKRTKGWRMPEDAVYVGRPTIFGNPYTLLEHLTLEECLTAFELFLEKKPERVRLIKNYLRGKDLACWCSLDQPCHADILLRIANETIK